MAHGEIVHFSRKLLAQHGAGIGQRDQLGCVFQCERAGEFSGAINPIGIVLRRRALF